uniref:Regulatory protein zeste n=1 Tax=Culicoides sonorensis TaxID=179676 RepID=A0A336MHR2_CULSO
MEPNKRARSKNFTIKDKSLLVDCVKPFLKVIECSETNKKNNERKETIWAEITSNFNSQSDNPRDAKALKSCYQHLKMTVKKENAEYKRQRFATGGGSEPQELEPTSVKLLSMLGSQILPLKNLYDSGSDYHHGSPSSSPSIETLEDITSSVISPVIDYCENSVNETLTEPTVESIVVDICDNVVTEALIETTVEPVVNEKIRFSVKRKSHVNKLDDISSNVQAKKVRLDDRSRIEHELVELKRQNYTKQNKLLDIQLETAVLQNEAAQLEISIKKTQAKYEETRLEQLCGVYSFPIESLN